MTTHPTDPIEAIVKECIAALPTFASAATAQQVEVSVRTAARLAYVAATRRAAQIAAYNEGGTISTERVLLDEAESVEGKFRTMADLAAAIESAADRIEKGPQ